MEKTDLIKNVTEEYGKRMFSKDKLKFINFIEDYCKENNLKFKLDKSKMAKNIIIGNLHTAKNVICAHYDTPPKMIGIFITNQLFFNILVAIISILLIIINPIIGLSFLLLFELYLLGFLGGNNKHNYNDNSSGVLGILYLLEELKNTDKLKDYVFVLFDNEEKGLLGSVLFSKMYRNTLRTKNIINLDCIGLGDNINIYSYNDELSLKIMNSINLRDKYKINKLKPSILKASDHQALKNFKSIMICTEIKKRKKFIMKNIHTSKDKELDLENIEVITEGILNL